MKDDYLILGGGVAGLSLARSLLEHEKRVTLLDTVGIGQGASGTPAALGNPATGPKAKLIWRAESCYKALQHQLNLASLQSEEPVFQMSGVLRPALDEKQARKMKKQFEATDWPRGWAEWLDRTTIKRLDPGICCAEGGVWLPVGLTIDAYRYMQQLCSYLQGMGLKYIVSRGYLLNRESDGWTLQLKGNEKHHVSNIIDCTGQGTVDSHYWESVPLEPVKGQLAVFDIEKQIPGRYALAAGGYIARFSENRIMVGSTYEHDFQTTEPTEEGADQLKEKLRRLLPYLEGHTHRVKSWADVRVSAHDHMPVIGAHPEREGLYLFTGLGSKGMLYSAHLADCFAEHLMKEQPLPEEVDIQRFL